MVPDLEHLAPQIAAGGEDRLLLSSSQSPVKRNEVFPKVMRITSELLL